MARIIAIANQKGGTGKTTSAVNIAAGLARFSDQQVLLVDIDPHANTTSVFFGAPFIAQPDPGVTMNTILTGQSEAAEAIRKVELQANTRANLVATSLTVLPSHAHLATAEMALVSAFQRENRLREALKPLHEQYAYIIIDCPPNLGLLTINALMAAQEVLIPVEPGYFPLIGLGLLRQTIDTVAAANTGLKIVGVAPVRVNRTNLAASTVEELSAAFGALLLPAIPERTAIGEAHANGQDIFSYAPDSDSAEAYKALVQEVIKRA
jgi:chromosome partitioning protein